MTEWPMRRRRMKWKLVVVVRKAADWMLVESKMADWKWVAWTRFGLWPMEWRMVGFASMNRI